MSHQAGWRRSLAVVSAAAVLLTGLSLTSAAADEGADETNDLRRMISEKSTAQSKGPVKRAPGRQAQGKQAQGKQAQGKSPSASSTDYAQGAISRFGRVADPASPNDGTVVRTDVVQDLAAQRLRATINLRPSSDHPVVYVYFGQFRGSTCQAKAGIAGAVDTPEASGGFPGTSGTFGVSRSRSGSVMTLTSVAGSTFRSAAYDCTFVQVRHSDGNTVRQNFYAEKLITRWTPKLSIDGGEPVKGAQRKWVTMRLEVRNSGRSAAANTRIVASGAGLKITPRSRNLGTISDRSTKYGVTFKARVAKGTKARKLRFSVAANGARAAKNFTVGVAPKPRRYTSLSGRYFWGFATSSLSDNSGWDTEVMWFLNKKWVYIGEARNAAVPRCRKTTKNCRTYTYNRRSGVAKVAGQRFKVTTYGYKFKVPGDASRHFEPVTFPRKGARLGANLINQDWNGYCTLM